MGGAAGLGSYVQDGNPGNATVAGVVSYFGIGGAGVVMDAISTVEFMRRYRAESAGIKTLRRDLDRTYQAFEAARNALGREQKAIGADMSRGGCEEPLDGIFRR